jgi:glycine cleavage system aminomethyltransferase T
VLPSVGGAGGMALIKSSEAVIDREIWIDVRGKRKLAKLAKKPLYFPKTK